MDFSVQCEAEKHRNITSWLPHADFSRTRRTSVENIGPTEKLDKNERFIMIVSTDTRAWQTGFISCKTALNSGSIHDLWYFWMLSDRSPQIRAGQECMYAVAQIEFINSIFHMVDKKRAL